MASMTVTVRANPVLFVAYLRVLTFLHWSRLLSDQAAMRLATSNTWLVLVKAGRGRWRFMR